MLSPGRVVRRLELVAFVPPAHSVGDTHRLIEAVLRQALSLQLACVDRVALCKLALLIRPQGCSDVRHKRVVAAKGVRKRLVVARACCLRRAYELLEESLRIRLTVRRLRIVNAYLTIQLVNHRVVRSRCHGVSGLVYVTAVPPKELEQTVHAVP